MENLTDNELLELSNLINASIKGENIDLDRLKTIIAKEITNPTDELFNELFINLKIDMINRKCQHIADQIAELGLDKLAVDEISNQIYKKVFEKHIAKNI